MFFTYFTLHICRTLGLIKPAAVKYMSEIFNEIIQSGLIISRLQMCHLNQREARDFYVRHSKETYVMLV